jgi:hypothetical protein
MPERELRTGAFATCSLTVDVDGMSRRVELLFFLDFASWSIGPYSG